MDAKNAKEEFISTLSHEIRTPLTSIKGFSKTMLENWEKLKEEDKKKFLQIILDQSDRLINLVENVLNVAKIENTETILKEIELKKAVLSAIELIKINYKEKKFHLNEKKVSNSIADKDKLEQVLVNILENACKYSSGEKPIEISILTDCDFNVVKVKNFGSYINKEDLDKIFDKFYREDSYLTSRTQGSGLGLYIAKTLIEKMGGKIEVKTSKEECFTEFSIFIPIFDPCKLSMKIKGGK